MKYLFKFILALFLFSTTLYSNIDECKTDIYFGNGVWNSSSEAKKSVKELQNIIDTRIIKGDPKLQAKYGEVELQYNWSHGKMIDVLETFYQLKEAGQISEEWFFTFVDELMAKQVGSIVNQNVKALREQIINLIISAEENDVNDMLEKYYNESLKYGHRVLLVSHSQGNMFANRVYDKINPTEYKKYFANLQVASPASQVKAEKGDYVTGFIDPAINPIPGSMTSNANLDFPGGHKFVEAYLTSQDTFTKIIDKTKQLLADLDIESSQWELDQELNKGTKDYKITLKHRFDTAITSMQNVEVYPFKPSAKLYRVGGNISGYVKASCGGTKILDADIDTWNNKKDNEVYYLEGTNEKIICCDNNLVIKTNLIGPNAYMDFYINDLHCYQVKYTYINASSYYSVFEGVLVADQSYTRSSNFFTAVDGVITIPFKSLTSEPIYYGDLLFSIHDPRFAIYASASYNKSFIFNFTLTPRADILYTNNRGEGMSFNSYHESCSNLEDIVRRLIR